MSQSIRITCTQKFIGDTVTGTGEFESDDMSMDGWRKAIEAAAAASGFPHEVLESFILEWAGDIERGDE